MTSTQRDKAARFHALHTGDLLVLPNAWDVASALIVEQAGAAALATTSAGLAWSLGASGVPLFVNARVDAYLLEIGEPGGRLRETLDRAAAYAGAGAELARRGVARVSIGPAIAKVAYAVARRAAEEVITAGTSTSLAGGWTTATSTGCWTAGSALRRAGG